MILFVAAIAVLVAATVLATVLNIRAARRADAAADEVLASVDQLTDIIAAAFLDTEEHIQSLQSHQSAMDAMAEQQVALRKQVKQVLKVAAQTNATAERYLVKQRHALDPISDLVYELEQQRKVNERG